METRSFYFVLSIVLNVFAYDPVVETKLGKIRGVRSSDADINMFMGIPYASVNKSNPFGVSIPHTGFDTVFEANNDSIMCPQFEEVNHTFVGDLDCLRLNIYTPTSVSTSSQLPVFVWIFGGQNRIGFHGKITYGPKYLVRHDIILVTINYRIGPYGFMCLDIPEVPGNQGLKDTLQALRWVQENIHSFGGDPTKVTIGGNSAGAMVVDYHMLRNTNGETLFHNAILQSGTSLSPMTTQPKKDYAIKMASNLGFHTDDVYAASKFLATVPPLDMMELACRLRMNIGPCVEKVFEGVEAFLTESVITAKHHVENVSVMIGITNDEGNLPYRADINEPNITNVILNLWFDTQHENFIGASDVRSFYFGDKDFGEDTLRGAVDMISDFVFVYPNYQSIKKILEDNVKSLYFYMFSYTGGRNFVRYRNNIHDGGAVHADELGYLFDINVINPGPSYEDQLVVDKMTTIWANFVKYGNPIPETTQLLKEVWKPVTKTSPWYCMVIDQYLTLTRRPFHDRMSFLNLLYKFNRHNLVEHKKVFVPLYSVW